ncbi:MAG TPA: hypothetical protein PKD59_14115 [Miltoncostaeaceae bacterium]|nr:hypothetical protein [Miltoncostaeaceae bacterium]
MTAADELRLAAALAQCEMALVRHDPVAGPLLAQAARHADGLPGADAARAAARLQREAGEDPGGRKVVQALTRTAVIENDAALLGRAG